MLTVHFRAARAELFDGRFGFFCEAGFLAEHVVEAACDFTGDFDVRHLVFAHRHLIGAVDQNVSALQQRIA